MTKQKEKPKASQEAQIEDLTNTLKRVQADFENYKKRTEREKQEFMQFATIEFVRKILPLLDNLELAFKSNQSEDDFRKGIELIYAQFKDLLDNHNIKEIEETKIYNPHLHEAMMVGNEEEPENAILEVFQKGYKLGEKVIRHSKVKVNKRVEENNNNKKSAEESK
jgi:molecular chaperone GrpE